MADIVNPYKFIPKFILNLFQRNSFYNNTYLLGQTGPVWISVVQPYELYSTIPELASVVDRRASMFSNMLIQLKDKKSGEIVEDLDLKNLLDNPNPLHSQNEWLKEYAIQKLCYGNQFIYKNAVNSSKYPISLWNISPYYLQPILTGKLFDQTSIEGIIKGYQMINSISMNGIDYNRKVFETHEILYTKIPDLNNPIIGKSPLASLKYPLSNIEASYEMRNVLMKKKGAIGMISSDAGGANSLGSIPLTAEEQKRMEDNYLRNYGIGEDQRSVILSKASLKWQSMTIPSKDMLLLEEVDADMSAICSRLGMNINLFLSQTTYENLQHGIIQTYQDTIIPEADEFMQALSPFLSIDKKYELVASFDHIDILKKNKLKGMEAIDSIVTSLTSAVQGGLISGTQAEIILANELGIKAGEGQESKTLNKLNRLSPLVANNVLGQLTINEQRDLVGMPPVEGGDKFANVPASNVASAAST